MSDSDPESIAEQSDGDEPTPQQDVPPTLDSELSAAEESESEIDREEQLIKTIRPDVTAVTSVLSDAELTEESEDDASDASEDTSDDEQPELDKLTAEMRTRHLQEFHPDSACGEDTFVQAMSVIRRTAEGDIDDSNHRTLPLLSKYERTRVLGLRAAQIDAGSAPLVRNVGERLTGSAIAIMELNEKKMPFIVQRPMPDGTSEYWKVSDLAI